MKRNILLCLGLLFVATACAVLSEAGDRIDSDVSVSEAEIFKLEDLPASLSVTLAGAQSLAEIGDYARFEDRGRLDFVIDAVEDMRLSLAVVSRVQAGWGSKHNDVHVNDEYIGEFISKDSGNWMEILVGDVLLVQGLNKISIRPHWGYFDVQSIKLDYPEDYSWIFNVEASLVNPDANDNTLRLMQFLVDNYGKKVISGQMDLTWDDSIDMFSRVYEDTGHYPALAGYDFMNYTRDVDGGSGLLQVEEAKQWWADNGIVSFMWHWRDPGRATYEFYSDRTDFSLPYDIEAAEWLTESSDYSHMIEDIDLISGELLRLQDAGVPVLWRPLHEASGRWFWWGRSGPDAHIAHWKLMYRRMTEHHGLNNLIWVWNGQHPDWYPGDDYVDIIGEDVYPGRNEYGSQSARFLQAAAMIEDRDNPKLIALTENGSIPDPDLIRRDGAWWSWFMVWNDGRSTNTDSNNFWSGEWHNDQQHKQHVYNHELVITRDDLPELSSY
ncbi:glycosyl hydrolase [Spirochaeta dissipatitropha]